MWGRGVWLRTGAAMPRQGKPNWGMGHWSTWLWACTHKYTPTRYAPTRCAPPRYAPTCMEHQHGCTRRPHKHIVGAPMPGQAGCVVSVTRHSIEAANVAAIASAQHEQAGAVAGDQQVPVKRESRVGACACVCAGPGGGGVKAVHGTQGTVKHSNPAVQKRGAHLPHCESASRMAEKDTWSSPAAFMLRGGRSWGAGQGHSC